MSKPEATAVRENFLRRHDEESWRGTRLKKEPNPYLGDTRECHCDKKSFPIYNYIVGGIL